LAVNGSYISVVHHGLHFSLFALVDSVTVLTIVYRLTGHQSRTEAELDLLQRNFRTSFTDCPSRETLVGQDRFGTATGNGPRRTTKCIRHCRVRVKVVDLVQEQRYEGRGQE